MQPVDFFEEGVTYKNSVGTYECKCVLEEHGRRYAFGLMFNRYTEGKGIPMTYRISDWPGSYVKVSE